jgi:glutathione S-transferase
MKLYYAPGACSLAPHILLRETGLDFDLVRVDTHTHTTPDGRDYHQINPKGQVPFLETGTGESLSEGVVIAQYIADQAGNRALMPEPGSMARYRVMEWQNYITSELHKGFSPLFNADIDANARAVFLGLLRKKLAWVDDRLADRTFLTGETFTAADAYLFVVCGWAKHVGLDLSGLDQLGRFLQTVAARPAVQDALRAEDLPAV